ncbi:MAG: UDP-N-acetylmuramoyl-tripeptide--D-alanyl-D-alanine ligase [Eubacterium sp.]|nr:UDP-N-acetylmuramoyl-tripeptide--D-alanyl-D-alanine ligase [Eubacterium sp.]
MKNLTLRNIALACQGTYIGPADSMDLEISAVTTDSRKVPAMSLFAAIKGERVDGHKFVRMAHDQGACACLIEENPEHIAELLSASEDEEYKKQARTEVLRSLKAMPLILVASTGNALMNLAEYYLRQLSLPVVGIIGSVGKTSTKEMAASVLEEKYRVLKTEGNFNNKLGLPLTIFRLTEEDQMAVLEMGIDDFGQMRQLAKIARPDTVVMTNIGTCHLDHLKDRKGVWRAKSEVFDYIRKGGHAVFNGEDDILATVHEIKGIRPLHFGLSEKAADGSTNDLWADEIIEHGFEGVSCTIHFCRNAAENGTGGGIADDTSDPAVRDSRIRVKIGMPGRHMVLNALAGASVGLLYGLTDEEIKKGIEKAETISGRFHILKGKRFTVIDDCYNANPMSMKASLGILEKGDSSRKVAILGDMGELGDKEADLHAEVGAYAAGLGIDAVYCAGKLSRNITERIAAAGSRIEIRWFQTREELQAKLPDLVRDGDTILVKASHFMNFGEILKELEKLQES